MKKVRIRVIGKRNEKRKGLFWSLACFFFALSTLYVYYVNTTAMNGVKWKDADIQASVTGSVISDLEANYLKEKRKVTLRLATELGFEDAKKVTFLSERPIEVSVR